MLDELGLTARVEVPWVTCSFDLCDDLDVWVCGLRDVFNPVPSLFEFPDLSAYFIVVLGQVGLTL